MAEIVTCLRCAQWVHDPEHGRVCAECKAEELEAEGREEIELQLAYVDAASAIEASAECGGAGCYSPELLDRWGAIAEGNHRQRLLIKALILVEARLALAYQRKTDQIRWS